jgi:predicted phage tail protein
MIGGSGGGGRSRQQAQAQPVAAQPQQYVPTESTNNLFSTSYAKILDLIGEGEIAGLVGGLQGIYLGNTPIQNPDGSLNFNGVWVDARNGTQSQGYISGFDEVASETGVGVVVTAASPVIRTITATADAARVVVTLPALQEYTDKGDILGTSVQLQVAVQYNGGGYSVVVDDTISGRTSQQYQRQYRIGLSGPFPVNIRVSRVTPDSTSSKLANAFSWASFSSITYAKLSYPNSALVGLRVDAEQFNSIPSRSYRVRGIKVAIPSNATVDGNNGRLVYSGVWNGAFGAAQWTSDPAWCLWDLLTSARYGFGNHLDASQLDKFAFYSASQYASALVPNGFGGYEPRFSCNANIQTADDAYRLINDLASTMRVMPYWAAGALTISQDRPSDPAFLFTRANVGPEGFNYSGSSIKSRPTVAVVRYQDLDLADAAYEVVEDAGGIARYGVVKAEIDAFACTSRGQAQRLGKWLLYAEQNEGNTCSFTSNLAAGATVRPGMIIEVADPLRAGVRRGGLINTGLLIDALAIDGNWDGLPVIDGITGSSTTAIALDDATGLTMANSPILSVMLADGTVQARAVTSITGNVVRVATAYSSIPQPNSVWIFESSNIQASLWRVLAVEERDGVGYAITALAHNASKYDFIEQGLALTQRDITDLNIIPDPPQNLISTEVLYDAGGRAAAKVQLSWSLVPGASGYRVSFREKDGNWSTQTSKANAFEILETKATTYEALVSSVGVGLQVSKPTALSVIAFGKTAPPTNVSGISLVPIDDASAILSWTRSTELDVLLGGKVLIRHNKALVGGTWEQAQEIVAAAAGGQTQKQVPLLEGTYLLKFEDDGGRRSSLAASAVVDLPAPQPRLLVKSIAEQNTLPGGLVTFRGTYANMHKQTYTPEFDTRTGIMLAGGVYVDSLCAAPEWDLLPGLIDTMSTNPPEGTYEFSESYTARGVYDVNFRRRVAAFPFVPNQLWDSNATPIDTWESVEGVVGDRVNATTYVRSANEVPTGSTVWSPWREFANAIVRGRAFQFKAVATSSNPIQNIFIYELGVDIEFQQRTESAGPFTAAAATNSISFTNFFIASPTIGITAYNMATGDYFVVSSVTLGGFDIIFRNAAGTVISGRNFTYTAVGFGRQVA